jgi:UDP-glucuronate decarboxylase
MQILITGGTGFFGMSLLRHFMASDRSGTSLTVLSRDPVRFCAIHPDLGTMVKWVRGDVLDPRSLPLNQQFSHVIHAAADSTLGPTLSPMERYNQIVTGTRNILDLAITAGAKRFLLASSGGVYGSQPETMALIPEEYCGIPDPLEPNNAYSVAKRTAEHLCALYQHQYGIEAIVARCFTFVGQDLPLDAHFAVGNFVRDALWRSEITVSGNGTAVRSYLDQSDLALWLVTLLEKGRPGRAYNVGSDIPVTIAELAKLVRDEISPLKRITTFGNSSLTDLVRPRYVPDIKRAKEELGLEVTVRLEAAIRRMALAHI